MTSTYYRADKRRFEVGVTIETARAFSPLQDEFARRTERLLADWKPVMKPDRQNCLMLFEDENCAKDYWAKLTGGKLYTVSISEPSILHRGDMHIVDEIDARLRNGGKACELEHLVDAYWRGDEGHVPCIEILVSSATVTIQLGTEDERAARFWQRYRISSTGPEPEEHPAADILGAAQRRAG